MNAGHTLKLKTAQEAHALALLDSGDHTASEVAKLADVSRATLARAQERRAAKGLTSVDAVLPGVDVGGHRA